MRGWKLFAMEDDVVASSEWHRTLRQKRVGSQDRWAQFVRETPSRPHTTLRTDCAHGGKAAQARVGRGHFQRVARQETHKSS